MVKTKMRKAIAQKAKMLPEEYCKSASEIICRRIVDLPEYIKAETVFIFVGTMKGEPDTTKIIEESLSRGKKVCAPLCVSDGVMVAKEIKNLTTDFSTGYCGLLEPLESLNTVDPAEIDFVLVPCVSCDYDGNRLGHGKGFYDRFLSKRDFDTALICYDELVSLDIPMESHDKAIGTVITDR